jgi:predicted HTH transcriptional regulator
MFKTLGYIQKYGIGIRVARIVMERSGNPPLEFDVDRHFVRCIVRKNRNSKSKGDNPMGKLNEAAAARLPPGR